MLSKSDFERFSFVVAGPGLSRDATELVPMSDLNSYFSIDQSSLDNLKIELNQNLNTGLAQLSASVTFQLNAIVTDQFAEASARLALDARVTTGLADVHASILNEQIARATALEAEATARLTMIADVKTDLSHATADILSEKTARATADEALASSIDKIQANFVTLDQVSGIATSVANAVISDEATVRANGDEALAQRITRVESSFITYDQVTGIATTIASAKVLEEAQARTTAISAEASRVDTVLANYTTYDAATGIATTVANAKVSQAVTTLAAADKALSERTDSVEASIRLTPISFSVVSKGGSASTPSGKNSGIYNSAGTLLTGAPQRSYGVVVFNAANSITYNGKYDLFADSANAAAMASYLNGLAAGTTVVIFTFDEPAQNRLSGGLQAAMERCGAGPRFSSTTFKTGSAYILVGRAGIGYGQGQEYYAGSVDVDTNSWLEQRFDLLAGVPQISGAGQLIVDVNARINTVTTAYTSADQALARRIDDVQANYTTIDAATNIANSVATAKVNSAVTTLAAADKALSDRTDVIETRLTVTPISYFVVSRGLSTPSLTREAGIYKADGTKIVANSRSYGVALFGASSQLIDSRIFDVHNNGGDASQATAMAAYLNGIGAGTTVVIFTYDEPSTNRLSGGLQAAMERCGAGPLFSSTNFKIRSAYILVGRAGIGYGKGQEYYGGAVDYDTSQAWIEQRIDLLAGITQLGNYGTVDSNAKITQVQQALSSADSAQTQRLTTLESSYYLDTSIVPNSSFNKWTNVSSFPDNWNAFWSPTIAKVPGYNGRPNALSITVGASNLGGATSDFLSATFGGYIFEFSGRATDWQAAGMLIQFYDANNNWLEECRIHAATAPDSLGYTSRDGGSGAYYRTFSQYYQTSLNGNIRKMRVFLIGNWDYSSWLPLFPKTVIFDRVMVRTATAAEIAGQVGYTQSSQALSKITDESKTRNDADVALASRTQSLEASYSVQSNSIVANPYFTKWPNASSPPDYWQWWDSSSGINQVGGINGHPYSVYFNAAAGKNCGIAQFSLVAGFGTYVIELSGRSTDWQGAGVLIQFNDINNNPIDGLSMHCATTADSSGNVTRDGGNGAYPRTFSKTYNTGARGDIQRINVYLMANWDGFDLNRPAKNIYFDKLIVRTANAAETTANDSWARIGTEEQVRAQQDKAISDRVTIVESNYVTSAGATNIATNISTAKVNDAVNTLSQANQAVANRATSLEAVTYNAININPLFSVQGYNGGIPYGWNDWSNGGQIVKSDQPGRVNTIPIKMTRQGSTNIGISQAVNNLPAGYYVIEAEVQMFNGNWQGSGVHVNFNNGYAYNIGFGSTPDTNNLQFAGNGYNRRAWSVLVYSGSQSSGNFYAMGGWEGFTYDGSWNETHWHKCLLRTATAGEIQSKKAQDSVDNLTSRVYTNEQAISGINGKVAAYWQVTADAGNNRAQLTVRADAYGGAGVDIIGDVSISGGNLKPGTVDQTKLSVPSLAAITATIGLLRSATSGLRTEIDNNGIRTYNASNVLVYQAGIY